MLVSMPTEDEESTVIWLLDEEEKAGEPENGGSDLMYHNFAFLMGFVLASIMGLSKPAEASDGVELKWLSYTHLNPLVRLMPTSVRRWRNH